MRHLKKILQVTTATESDDEMMGPPFTQCAASSVMKRAFEGDIISDSEPGTASEDDIMVVDFPKAATSENRASYKAPRATSSVGLISPCLRQCTLIVCRLQLGSK